MTFSESVKTVLHDKYATFTGRASRSEYWWFVLFNCIIVFALLFSGMIIGAVFGFSVSSICGRIAVCGLTGFGIGVLIGYVLMIIYGLATLVPSIAVSVRRLHDTGHSGWWYLLGFVPYVGGIVLLVFMLLASTPGDNVYGPNPCDAPEGE